MKKYNPTISSSGTKRPEWAKGLKSISLNEKVINDSDENLFIRLTMLRERREKCNHESCLIASDKIYKD